MFPLVLLALAECQTGGVAGGLADWRTVVGLIGGLSGGLSGGLADWRTGGPADCQVADWRTGASLVWGSPDGPVRAEAAPESVSWPDN